MQDVSRTQHLSDAEFGRLLDGAEPGPAVEAHLAACVFCREELAVVQESLGSFRDLSTLWAELEAPRHLPVPARWLHKRSQQLSWGGGLAATAVAGLLAFWLGFAPHVHPPNSPRLQAMAPTNAELAADNRLLLAIDSELSDQAQMAAPTAELRSGVRQDFRHSAHRVVGATTD